MLLVIIALLLSLGLGLWIIGEVLDFTAVAVIGASLVLIAGSGMALTGMDVRSGMVQTKSYTQVDNSTVVNSTSTAYTYETRSVAAMFGVGILGSLGLGGLVMILAASMFGRTLSKEGLR